METPGAPVEGRRTVYTDDGDLPEVSDEAFAESRGRIQSYSLVILKAGPRYSPPGPDRDPQIAAIIHRHGKRNMALRQAGLMPIICPIADGSDYTGMGIFTTSPEETELIYSRDPAVVAGVLSYEVHPTRSFPGSALP